MDRIEEITRDGKNILYIDFSKFKSNDEFAKVIEEGKPLVRKYEENSLYTITNIEGVRYDTSTKEIMTEWMIHNKPYVKHGVVIGLDGIKKIMFNALFTLSGRKSMDIASTKEAAIELLLQK